MDLLWILDPGKVNLNLRGCKSIILLIEWKTKLQYQGGTLEVENSTFIYYHTKVYLALFPDKNQCHDVID